MEDKLAEILRTRQAPGVIVKKVTPFKSHVDGSIITNHRQLEEHNKRNAVVDVREWGNDDFCDSSAKKAREKFLLAQDEERKREIRRDAAEALQKLEQGYKPKVEPEGDL